MRTAGTAKFVGPSADRLTFDDLATMLLTDYRVNGRRSLRDAQRAVRWLRNVFGFDRALDITTDRISRYAESRLRDGAKPATINRELAALRRMLSLAVKAGKLPTRPHVPMLDEHNAREGFFDAAELDALRQHLPADLGDFAAFAFLTGWRKGEIQTLTWADVDLKACEIRLRAEHSKNKRGRLIKLSGELLELIEHRQELRRLECHFVFHRVGRQIGDFRKAWARACKDAGLPKRLFHDLRRSAVMVRAHVPEAVAMKVSGHRTRSVFERYNIVSEQDLADAAERTMEYVEQQRGAQPSVVPLRSAAGGKRRQ